MSREKVKWEFCEIYKRPTNLSYANAQGRPVYASYFSVNKLDEGAVLSPGIEIHKTKPWLPDATAVKNVSLTDSGLPSIAFDVEEYVLRRLIAKLGLDGWEPIFIKFEDRDSELKGFFKRKIEEQK
jgi:hypothetical protein